MVWDRKKRSRILKSRISRKKKTIIMARKRSVTFLAYLLAFLLRMNDPIKTNWDIFVMILATYNCFAIPYEVAFEPPMMEATFFTVLDWLIDFLFLVDIFINFRTTVINSKNGEEITDTKELAKEYMKGRFWIDLLATIPLDEIGTILNSML